MNEQTEMEKCTVYKRRGDRCEIKCKLGLWSVDGPCGLALMSEANHYFQQYRDDGEYDKLLTTNAELRGAKPIGEESRSNDVLDGGN